MDLYVYYKVQGAHAARMQEAVIAMQAALSAAHKVAPQLKRRPLDAQPTGAVQTWMEVYPAVAGDTFLVKLEAASLQAGLAQWIDGARHVEIFEDLPPCA